MVKHKRTTVYWLADALCAVMMVMLRIPVDPRYYTSVEMMVMLSVATAFFPSVMAIFNPNFRLYARWWAFFVGLFYLNALEVYGRELEISWPALVLIAQIFIPRHPLDRREDDLLPKKVTVASNFSRLHNTAPAAQPAASDILHRPFYTAERALKNWSLRLPKLTFPPVTLLLIALNVALFFVGWRNAPGEFDSVPIPSLKVFPLAMTRETLEIPAEWWRLLSATFFHWSVAHLVSNMLFLFWLGRVLEPMLGRVRYLVYYVLGGIISSVAGGLSLESYQMGAGASGAIFALMGIYLSFLVVHFRVLDEDARRRWVGLIFFLLYTAYNIWAASQTGISTVNHAAHVGGFTAGIALMLLFGPYYTAEADSADPNHMLTRERHIVRRWAAGKA